MSQGTSSNTLIRSKALKNNLSGVQKSTSFLVKGPGFLVKNDQILKSAFFTCLCP